jgi:hypothetical protein
MKSLTKKLLGAVAGIWLASVPIQKTKANDLYFFGDVGFNLNVGSNFMEVNYPEDSYLPYGSLDVILGVGVQKNSSNFEIGLKGSGITAGFLHTSNDVNSIGYKGPENHSWSPGLYAKASLFPPQEANVLHGMSLEYNLDFLQKIWEDELFQGSGNKLADAISQTAKLGYEMRVKINHARITANIFGGMSFPTVVKLTDLGREKELKLKPNVFAGYSVKFGLASH